MAETVAPAVTAPSTPSTVTPERVLAAKETPQSRTSRHVDDLAKANNARLDAELVLDAAREAHNSAVDAVHDAERALQEANVAVHVATKALISGLE